MMFVQKIIRVKCSHLYVYIYIYIFLFMYKIMCVRELCILYLNLDSENIMQRNVCIIEKGCHKHAPKN